MNNKTVLNNRVTNGSYRNVKRSNIRRLRSTAVLLLVMAVAVFALTPAGKFGQTAQGQGSRTAGVKPKRTSQHAQNKITRKTANSRLAISNSLSLADSPLATADFDLVGLAVTAGPATQTVPKNTPTAVITSLQVPDGSDQVQIIANLNPNYRIRGELTGPSLSGPLTLEAAIGQPLQIPALPVAGDHLLQNLRIVDTGTLDQPSIASVTPDSCGLVVIERLLVSQVSVKELTYDQIIQSGININDDAHKFFNFTLGLGTISGGQKIDIPVAFPTIGSNDPRPIVGHPQIGAGVTVPTPDVVPVMLQVLPPDGTGNGAPLTFAGAPIQIPGVVVFPGRVGLLNQFFEAILIVANGAPNGAPLVVKGLTAKINLPDSASGNSGDVPLIIAPTQTGGAVSQLPIHGLGPDGKYGTGDDLLQFSPGQSGQASFLIEGLKEGLHTVSFDLQGTLEGLPIGPVTVKGNALGAVLVRDASFAVTFTHPSTVRAGQDYDLAMTVYNSGSRDILGAVAQLASNSVSGANLIGSDNGQRPFATTIPRGQTSTVTWRLHSNTTGAVTASYVKVGTGIESGLALTTGVGDRNVPLSPDSLILPDTVQFLPASVVEASRELLGQAWSIANAPPGGVPTGVTLIDKQTVVDRAVELGVAGLRVEFGEPVNVSLETLLRDWLGELQTTLDPGFADALRNTTAGFNWLDSIGAQLYQRVATGQPAIGPLDLHSELVNTEAPRSAFISAIVSQPDGAPIVGTRLIDSTGKAIGFGASTDERFGDLPSGASLLLANSDNTNGEETIGQELIVSNPSTSAWTLEINGWQTGTADVSLLVPRGSQNYNQFIFHGISLTAGDKYRVVFQPLTNGAVSLEKFVNGAYQSTGVTASPTQVNEPAPRLVGALQVSPQVLDGGDKYGRLVGLLFSKPVASQSAQTASLYKIGGGALAGSPSTQVGGPVKVSGATLNFGGRFVFLALDSPIGPYIKRDVTVTGLTDAHGFTLTGGATAVPIVPTVSPQGIPPGAYLTGRVLLADGTPVPNAPVIYWTQPCLDFQEILPPEPVPITTRATDINGQYEVDYVRNGDCGPVVISATNPANSAEKRVATPVVFDGQHMVLDTVFLARGSVQGTVTSGGQPSPFAFVKVVPALDANGVRVVQADGQGHYLASDIPVGNMSVLAVGTGAQSNASGQAAGNLSAPGATATINVSMQNVSGSVQGRVVNSDSAATPDVGALVIAFADLGDFGSDKTVGYAYTGTDGSFTINNLPIGNIRLQVTDYSTGVTAGQVVQLTQSVPTASNILIVLAGTGSVSGQVVDEVGTFIPNAVVQSGNQAVAADAVGFFTLTNLPAGNQTITATDPNTRLSSSISVLITAGGTISGVRIAIVRPAVITGHVFIANSNGTTSPVAGAIVSYDGRHQVQTDANGLYTLNNVSANTSYMMRFVHPGQTLGVNQPIVLAAGETVNRDAIFRPAAIHGKVFQPDGVTGTVASVTLFAPLPTLEQSDAFGLLTTERTLSTQSASDGSYAITNFNPGTFRVSASNGFFPIRVSRGGVIAAGEDQVNNLVLVTTLAGKIQGRILQPDGVTPVGAGVKVTLGGGSLADVTVNTDANGHYEFAEVFAAGTYYLTATDPATGNTNRARVSVQSNQDALFDLRLLGSGGLRVHVVDGAGVPVANGSVTIDGTGYPNVHGFVQLTTDINGIALFSKLPEGQYAVAGTSNGLSGRASVFVPAGAPVDATVQLQASGTVSGTIFLPDGTTPVSLADIQLLINGQTVGFTVSSNTDGQLGTFSFPNVPAGEFVLLGFDNRSGRVARSGGRISTQGETAVVNLTLVPVGAVTGHVTQNGSPVDHASIEITAGESGFNFTSLKATTDPNGSYRFTGIPVGVFRVSVTNGPGGLAGGATGTVNPGPEPLADTVVDIALAPSATVAGTVFRFDGTTTVNGAHISATVNSRVFETSTDANGNYRIDWLPLGQIQVQAEAPTGFDRGIASPVIVSQPGSTVTANVRLNGVGNVTGIAFDSNGSPLFSGNVTLTNDALQPPINMTVPVDVTGHYSITGAPAGPVRLTLVVAGRVEVGTASTDLPAGQTIDLPIRLADAGTVTGKVLSIDGVTAATGADVTLSVFTINHSTIQLYTHTNNQGRFTIANVPLGSVTISVFDAITGGVAFLNGGNAAQLGTNGQTVDIGTLALDNSPITIVSVTPANNATGVNEASVVTVRFSEAASPATVNNVTIQLLQGATFIPSTLTLSADGKTATLTPTSRLNDLTTYTVVVTTGVSDLTNHFLVTEFRSTFTTDDETAPSVVSISPVANALDVPLDSTIIVTFSEPIDRTQDLTTLITVTTNQSQQITGAATLDDTGKIATFTPTAGLVQSTIYTVRVTGQSDLVGNVQTAVFTSSFTSFNPAPMVSITNPAEGATPVEGTTITVAATASDDTSIASVSFNINGFTLATVTTSPYQMSYSIPMDTTSLLIIAKATDSLGKFTTASRTVSVRKSNRAPVVDAGPDQTLELPNVASLTGSATDDGLPEGSTLAYTWAKISGPGSVVFANPNAASTTASFGSPGTYVLQLAVSDSLLVGTDQVTILVTPTNQAPIVSAGANQSISYPNLTANLNGSVTDDGLPHGTSVTSTWSKVAGPGTALFLNPSAPVTTVTFSAPGIYRLRLTANDTALSASSDVFISVGSACLNIPTGLVAWWQGDGDAHDSSLQGHDGTLFGGASFGSGILGQSFHFDGTGSVQVSDDPSLKPNQFTVEGWVKFDTLDTPGSFNIGREFVVFKQNGTQSIFGPDTRGAIEIYKERANTNDDRLAFVVNQGGNSLVSTRSTTKMSVGQFYHFAASYDGFLMKLYINGLLESTAQAPGLSYGLGGPLVFGSSGLPGDSKLTGSVDEIHFFNRILADSEIGSLILSDRTENCTIPSVNAGPDQTVTLPSSANLVGSATNANDPNFPLVYSWSVVSGPGPVTFGNASSPATTASFTAPGTYVLQLTASNDQKTGTDTAVITVITPCIQSPSGLIGWWKGEGNGLDSSAVGNDGGLVNGVSFVPGVSGQAFKFSGTNFVQIPDTPSLKPANITVDAWVDFDSLDTPGASQPGLQYIVLKKNTRTAANGFFEGYALFKFRDNNGNDRLYFMVSSGNGNTAQAISTTVVTTGQFYHATGTYDGSTAKIYVNGALDGTAQGGFPMDYGTRPVFFGTSGETSFDGKLSGALDEVHIFNRALSASEIATIDHSGGNAVCSPPVVNAGQNQTVTFPNLASLSGSASDPNNPTATFNYLWTVVSSPGQVTFSNPTSPNTTASFTAPGDYDLRLTAINGQVAGSADVIVKVATTCIQSPSGMVAWWRAENDARDSSGAGNNGTSTGNLAFVPGFNGKAFSLNGVDSYVATNLDVQPSTMPSTTWDAWVYPTRTNFSLGETILSIDDGGFDRSVIIQGNSPNFGIFTGSGVWQPTNFTPNQWQHIAVVYTPNNIEFYKDGVRFSLGSAPTFGGSANRLQIGRNPGFNALFEGLIDEVHVFNRALTPSEITALDQSNQSGICIAPIVNAGPSQTVALPSATASLNGSAVDPFNPGSTLTYLWTIVSGPGSVNFANSTAPATTASFTVAGTYVLRLSASNGQQTGSADVVINVGFNCAVAPSGMVAWWRAENDTKDSSGNGNDGTALGNLAFAQGFNGKAFSQSGFAGYVATNLDVQPSAMPSTTWDAWVYPTRTNFSLGETILSIDDGGFDRSVIIQGNSPNFGIFTGSGVWQPTNFTPNQWQHIAVVYTPTNIEFYKDGVRFSFGSAPTFGSSANRLQIGRNPGFDAQFEGLIDEVHIFNRALNPSEVTSLRQADHFGVCLPPIVNAGQDQTISYPNSSANLSGTASDPSNPGGALNYSWSVVSGSGSVSFANPSSLATTASFTSVGTYVLRLSASNGLLTGSATVTIRILPACDTPPSGLVGWWRGEGNARDFLNRNNGILVNNPEFTQERAGQGFVFNGSNYVQISDSPDLKPTNVTVDAWVRFDSLDTPGESSPGLEYILFKQNSRIFSFEGYNLLKLRVNGQDRIRFYISSANGTQSFATSTTNIVAGQFYHVTGSYDGITTRLYINGVLEGQAAGGFPIDYGTLPVFLGTSGNAGFDGKLIGELDEVHIFNRALSGLEVQALFQADGAGICADATNQAPVVDAGQNQTIDLPNSASLNGSAVDPLNGALTYLWTMVSGPASMAFGNATTPTTTATFTQAGNYVLRLTATAGGRTGSADLLINVNPACVAAPSGLAGWWRGEGNADDFLNLNNGTLINNPVFTPAVVGQGIQFSGTNSVSIPDSSNLRPASLTLDAWVRFDSLDTPGAGDTGLQYLAFKRGNGPFEAYSLIKLRRNGIDNFVLVIGSDPSLNTRAFVTSTTALTIGRFYHVAGTYDGANLKLYVNGVLEASLPTTFALGYQPGQPLRLGSTGDSFDGKLTGVLDEVHVFDRALSASEIHSLFLADGAGICTSPPNPVSQSFLSAGRISAWTRAATSSSGFIGSDTYLNARATPTAELRRLPPPLSLRWSQFLTPRYLSWPLWSPPEVSQTPQNRRHGAAGDSSSGFNQ